MEKRERITGTRTLYVKAYNATFAQIIDAFQKSLQKYERLTKQKYYCHFMCRMWKTDIGLTRAYVYITNDTIYNLLVDKDNSGSKASFISPIFLPTAEQRLILKERNLHQPFHLKCTPATIFPLENFKAGEKCSFAAANVPSWITPEMVQKKFHIIAGGKKELKPKVTLDQGKLTITYNSFCSEINFIYCLLRSLYVTADSNRYIIQLKPQE